MTRPTIFYRHFDLPKHFPVIGLLGNAWQSTPDPVTRQHFHNCLEIGFLFEGKGELYAGDETLSFEAPCLLVLPPRLPHANRAAEGCTCRWNWLYLDPQMLLSYLPPRALEQIITWQQNLAGDACVLPEKEFPQAYALVRMAIEEMERAASGYRQITTSLLGALLQMLARQTTGQTALQQKNQPLGSIEPAVQYIAEHYMDNITIADLAAACHLSATHFRRVFKQILGHSPMDYVHIIRIDRACVLLYNHNQSVTEVGQQVGYFSPSSFSRQFHRIHGVSPNQWRLKMRSEENPTVSEYFESLPPETSRFFPLDF